MVTPRLLFIRVVIAWLVAATLVLTLAGWMSAEAFLVAALLGLFTVLEVTAPYTVRPRWRVRLRVVVAGGVVALLWLLARRVALPVP
jgi:hypothetical protein